MFRFTGGLILVSVIAVLTVVGCTKEEDTTSPAATNADGSTPEAQPTEVQATEAPNRVPAAAGAVAEFAHVRVYLNAIQDPWTSDNTFIAPDAGKRFVSFDVTIEYFNVDDTHSANPFYFGLSDTENFAYDPTFYGPEPSLGAVDLRPNEKVRGWVTFQVAEGTPLQLLRYKPNIFKDTYIEFSFQ